MFKYFDIKEEFLCPCCGGGLDIMKYTFVKKLDNARDIAGVSFNITSGYRCPLHNAEVGSKPTSSHIRGVACDIAVKGSVERFAIVNGLIKAGFTRIGIGKDFVHVDADYKKSPYVMWMY